MMKLHGLYTPKGTLCGVYDNAWFAWHEAFQNQAYSFQAKYWKKINQSRRAMRKLGWNVVEGKFVKCK